jgi:hypothetical protein
MHLEVDMIAAQSYLQLLLSVLVLLWPLRIVLSARVSADGIVGASMEKRTS